MFLSPYFVSLGYAIPGTHRRCSFVPDKWKEVVGRQYAVVGKRDKLQPPAYSLQPSPHPPAWSGRKGHRNNERHESHEWKERRADRIRVMGAIRG